MPDLSTVHIDSFLTNLSVMYVNPQFVAEDVMPPLPVDKRSDKYPIYDKSTALAGSGLDPATNRPKSLRRPKTPASLSDYTLSSDSFYCEEYAKRQLVTDAEVKLADMPLSPEIDATTSLTEKLKIDNEVVTASIACTSTNYGSSHKALLTTGSTGTSWASYASANSHPLSDIKNGVIPIRKDILRQPNAALFTVDAAQTLADHPDIKDLIKYVHADALTTSGLPAVLRGLTTIEGATQKATSAEGAAFASGNVWQDENGTNVCLIFYKSTDVSPRSVHFGRTMDAPDDTTNARGISVRKYRDDELKGTWVEAQMLRDWKIVALDGAGKAIGGYLISGTTL